MTHDQRPGKMRLVADAKPAPARDNAASAPQLPPPPAETGPAPMGMGAKLLLGGLFLIGCAAGGTAIALIPGSGLLG
ncbi:hypothetical protein [Stakelama tenebrarum]|uniref:Uncharacterized protein n=1 Tax=Stakelama tenebrarum TaxID=2711215 RepID=A0A6G6Y438_9SPHN|nr:hypothetical protein [Sphingosinithalassobacter tenebrarum]QIG79670.1 hypothetical protein G5C33_07610 [Sphingosinithalassobacter tenebrarum]